MLFKFIDKYTIKRANYNEILEYDNKQVINPREEDFIKAGYKEVQTEEEPIYDENTQYLVNYYEELEDKILQKWEIREIEESEEI